MFEDEIELLTKEKDEIQANHVIMKSDYEQEVARIIANHKS